jgi:phosphate/sulfate permease
MYAFGYNNVALFSRNIVLTASAIAMGTYLGLGFSRWAADLVALRQRTAVSINLSAATGALIGILAHIPISFTLVAYSAMLVASYSSAIRVVKIEKFLRAYLGIIAALLAALIFRAVEPQLRYLASRVS